MKLFKCQSCGQFLYFENRQCQGCGHRLGYLPEAATLSAMEEAGDRWRALDQSDGLCRFCANADFDACNWLVPDQSEDRFCTACRHNRTIPDLTVNENLARWRTFEAAKHRLFYTLIRLNLPHPTRAEDPEHGLAFDFLETPSAGESKVMTGHESGLITLNINEADDLEREKLRVAMGEPYRTVLGHLRHESGHYFWDRLVCGEGRAEAFRELFGDERQNYEQALQTHYAHGPAANWQQSYISGYATTHPWEDFAETWAHYLHIVDTLEMAFAFGLRIEPGIAEHAEDSGLSADLNFDPHAANDIHLLIQAWLPLTFAVNSINSCMGEPNLYPFVLSAPVITKMGFIHEIVRAHRPR